MFPVRSPVNNPYIIGHRGAGARAPENTFESFRMAERLGADLIECDVHLSADDRIVIIHDETLERTTDGTGRVRDFTLEELKTLDAGNGQPIPTLEELFSWIRSKTNLGVAIEIKGNAELYPNIARFVAEEIVNHRMLDRSITISFNAALVREVRNIEPRVATGLLLEEEPADLIRTARAALVTAILPSIGILTPEMSSLAQEHLLAVYTWVVNEPNDVWRALSAGVDGIGTDDPEIVARAMLQSAA